PCGTLRGPRRRAVGREPAAHAGAEGFLLGRVREIHRADPPIPHPTIEGRSRLKGRASGLPEVRAAWIEAAVAELDHVPRFVELDLRDHADARGVDLAREDAGLEEGIVLRHHAV